MLQLLSKLFDKHTWLNLLAVLLIVLTMSTGFVYLVSIYPASFTVSKCEIRDEISESHNKTYRVYTERTDGSVNIHVSIIDKVKKHAKQPTLSTDTQS